MEAALKKHVMKLDVSVSTRRLSRDVFAQLLTLVTFNLRSQSSSGARCFRVLYSLFQTLVMSSLVRPWRCRLVCPSDKPLSGVVS
jgi:hypothetical protein